MDPVDQRDPSFRNKFWFVAAVFLVLMGLAHLTAEWCARRDGRSARHGGTAVGNDLPASIGRDAASRASSYRSHFTLCVATVLVIPAFGFYILQRPFRMSSYWLLFWTVGYLAYLVHGVWAYLVPSDGAWAAMLKGRPGLAAEAEVGRPLWSLILTVWWGVDVLLAWGFWFSARRHASAPLHLQRGALHLYAFMVFLAVTVFAPASGPLLTILGTLLSLAVLVAFALRIATRRVNPESLSSRLYRGFFIALNHAGLTWYRLPTFLGVMNLGALRDVLRSNNLVGTEDIPVSNPAGRDSPPGPPSAEDLRQRHFDGYYNDLRPGKWEMGSASTNSHNPASPVDFDRSNPGARFGRNVPRAATYPDAAALLEPSPRDISRQLLARDTFKEATILNFLAAAWVQFQTHDWFFHGTAVVGNEIRLKLDPNDTWDPGQGSMVVRRTRPDPTRDYAAEAGRSGGRASPPPTYANAGTHWWDASQIYGDDPITTRRLRTPPGGTELVPDGKLYVDANQLLPIDPTDANNQVELTGFNGNWWLGLTLLHTIFVREHNAICDRLRAEYPRWDPERVYAIARLVNAALMAKIHTVEWTPAILPNPCLKVGMNANWWGLAGEPVKKVFGRISDNDEFSGIPGSAFNHHAADYSLTEEFVSVYRMHPLMRDDLTVYSASTGEQVDAFRMDQVLGPQARQRGLAKATLTDLFYSFGICHPGSLTLRNYPNFLRDLRRPDGDRIDLAAVDILRDRERGVPRYNEFRRWLHLPRFRSLDAMISASAQLQADRALAQELRRIYANDIERVDLMVGLFAETPPPSFGFSDTAFRVFILMASRRLKSDRFLTTDFTPSVYSPAGFAWVNEQTMRTVLLRHYPGLAPALRGVDNVFAPWRTLAESRAYDPYEPDLDAPPS
jgi:hypothetical protein